MQFSFDEGGRLSTGPVEFQVTGPWHRVTHAALFEKATGGEPVGVFAFVAPMSPWPGDFIHAEVTL